MMLFAVGAHVMQLKALTWLGFESTLTSCSNSIASAMDEAHSCSAC